MPRVLGTMDKPSESKSFVHVGNSMYPALRALDQVYVTSTCGKILQGDIVVFQYGPTEKMIAHRVMSIGSDGIRTMGDNNPKLDDLTLRPEMIIGKVTSARRGKRMIRVRGGIWGRLLMVAYRVIKKARKITETILVIPYHMLARSGLFRIWLPDSLKYRVIRIKNDEHVSMLLMMSGRAIGRYNVHSGEWLIKPPYKLFVDEASLCTVQMCGEQPGEETRVGDTNG